MASPTYSYTYHRVDSGIWNYCDIVSNGQLPNYGIFFLMNNRPYEPQENDRELLGCNALYDHPRPSA
jgi:hypothetical protein